MFAMGSAGDVHPSIGIARALHQRGHRVLFATNSYFQPAVRAVGVDFLSTGAAEEYLAAIQDPDLWQFGKGFRVLFSKMLTSMREVYRIIEDRYIPNETLVVAPSSAFGARMANEKLGVPLVNMHLQPLILRSLNHQPGLALPEYCRPLLRPLRRVWLAALDRWIFDPALLPETNALRAELGLPPVRRILKDWIHSPDLSIGLFPPWFAPPQPDWPPQLRLTGFPMFDEAGGWEVPAELARFLDDGEPPIVFTLGTAMRFARQFFEVSAEACELLGRRGIFLTHFPEQLTKTLPDGVRHFAYVPFSVLLPRASALVHHGGIGTMAQAMAAGIPQLITPVNLDQPDNAVRLRKLGVGDLIRPKDYEPKRASARLLRLLTSLEVAGRCREVAARFQGAGWVDETCRLIESVPLSRPPTLGIESAVRASPPAPVSRNDGVEVLMFAPGSGGDVYPNIAIGKALGERGHNVLFVASSAFEAAVEAAGLEFLGSGTVGEDQRTIDDPNLWRFGRGFRVLFERMLEAMPGTYRLIEKRRVPGRTVVVAPFAALGARIAAEKLDVPLATVHLQPVLLRSLNVQPGVVVPSGLRPVLRPARRILTFALDRWVFDPVLLPRLNGFRAELGLPPVERVLKDWIHSPEMVIGLFPEWFAAPQPDWPPNTHLTGFPLIHLDDGRETPSDVEDFLSKGDPPIVFTLGTAMRFAKRFFEVSVEVCLRTGRRGVLLTQFSEQVPAPLPPGVRHFQYVPFDRLLSRSAAVVHHGGIGTAAHALAAGIPQLLTPLNFDQPDNAARLRHLGVADSIPLRRYEAKRVSRTLEKLIASPEGARKRQVIAAKFAGADAIGRTCQLIESLRGRG